MIKRIKIQEEESRNVEAMFYTYQSYLSVLTYLVQEKNVPKNDFVDKKFQEAIELNIKLEQEKERVANKYFPDGEWDSYVFRFQTSELEFARNE